MTEAILLLTASVELGILVGAGFDAVHRFIRDGRAMVLHAASALRRT